MVLISMFTCVLIEIYVVIFSLFLKFLCFLVRYFLWKKVQGNTQSTKLDFLNYYLLQTTCLC